MPQRVALAGNGSAQLRQRDCGCANWLMQASHTGCAGQAWQTRHWLGNRDMLANRVTALGIKRDNMDSIYSRPACSTLP